jgi:hypothetical protein
MLFLSDHRATTIDRVVAAVKKFREDNKAYQVDFRVKRDEAIKAAQAKGEEYHTDQVNLRLATGSVGVAAVRLGRRFLGTDLNPEAVQLSAQQMERMCDTCVMVLLLIMIRDMPNSSLKQPSKRIGARNPEAAQKRSAPSTM